MTDIWDGDNDHLVRVRLAVKPARRPLGQRDNDDAQVEFTRARVAKAESLYVAAFQSFVD